MHLADFMIHTGVKEHTLGRRGLARVNVGRNADVPVSLNGSLAWHKFFLKLKMRDAPRAPR
jgi:hypothetical protein